MKYLMIAMPMNATTTQIEASKVPIMTVVVPTDCKTANAVSGSKCVTASRRNSEMTVDVPPMISVACSSQFHEFTLVSQPDSARRSGGPLGDTPSNGLSVCDIGKVRLCR